MKLCISKQQKKETKTRTKNILYWYLVIDNWHRSVTAIWIKIPGNKFPHSEAEEHIVFCLLEHHILETFKNKIKAWVDQADPISQFLSQYQNFSLNSDYVLYRINWLLQLKRVLSFPSFSQSLMFHPYSHSIPCIEQLMLQAIQKTPNFSLIF